MAHDVKCIIAACDNSKSLVQEAAMREVWFYEFPTDPEFQNKWIKKCGKGEDWDPNGSYVCAEHFPEEDFEPSTGPDPSVKRKLVPTAVPILRLQNECDILEAINKGNELSVEKPETGEDILKNNESLNFISAASYEQLLHNFQKVAQLNDDLKRHLCISKRSLANKSRHIKKLEKETINLHSQLDTQRSEIDHFEQALQHFFTGAQKHLVISYQTDGEWNTDALVRTLAIRYLSERCYNYLCQHLVYSLPDLHSLQQWVLRINFRQGILHEFLSIMQIVAKELSGGDRIAVLQFGNMKVKQLYEYKKESDEVVAPSSHMQVIMVTALFGKWKQPVYLSFDTKMTSDIIMELITKLHGMSYSILACISDWYEDMPDLWEQLKINSKRSYFRHPITDDKVYYFVDTACLLRNIRDIFIRDGFTLSTGKTVNTEPLKHLISSKDAENQNCTINKTHLEPCTDDSQDLIVASQLFCTENAQHLKRAPSSLAYSTGVFVENISKWYIIARQNYGKRMYEENLILNATSDMISKLVAANGTRVYLLQEAMLMSIDSLRLLPLRIWEKYNTLHTSIPTEKLNNNELNDLFNQIRGGDSSISPSEAVNKLRTIILDKNQESNHLIQKVLRCLNCPEVTNQEDEDDSTLLDTSQSNISSIVYTEDDEVHYLIASVADKLLSTHPELGTRIRDLTLDPPYENTLVNIESFVEPADSWALQARQLNKIFTKFHKKELLTGKPNLTKQLIDIVKKIYPDIDLNVARCFLQERLMLRIKYLNAELEKSQTDSNETQQAAPDSEDQRELPEENIGV